MRNVGPLPGAGSVALPTRCWCPHRQCCNAACAGVMREQHRFALTMDPSTPARGVAPSRQRVPQQLLPLLCCLAIQAMWLGVIRGLEGVVTPQPSVGAQARPSLNL